MSFGFKFDPFSEIGMSAPDESKNEDGSFNINYLEQIHKIFVNPVFKKEVELAVFDIWSNANKDNFDLCTATAKNMMMLFTRLESLNNEYLSYIQSRKTDKEYEEDSEQKLDTL